MIVSDHGAFMMARVGKKSMNHWTRSADKEKYWQKQLESWRSSGLSVRAYVFELIQT
jgi:hypothetical protein